MDLPGADDPTETQLLLNIQLDDDFEIVFLLLQKQSRARLRKFLVMSQFVSLLHPGSGNYERSPGSTSLVNLVPGWSRFDSLPISLRNSAIEMTLGISVRHFQWLCTLVTPWIELPRHFSMDFFHTSLRHYVFHPIAYYEAHLSNRGRPPSQSATNRFLHYFLFLKYGGSLSGRIGDAR